MKQRTISSLLLLLFLLITAFSCSKDPKVEPILPKGRTVLVYVALDNNLSNEMGDVHASLREGWKNTETEGSLLILADTYGAKKPVLIKLEKRKGVVVSDTLRSYDNDNSASAQLLSQVIADTKVIAPANSYGLVLFSHATGWLPAKAFGDPAGWGAARRNDSEHINRSIFEDNGREMEFDDFVEAIPDGMFDFIASEMCFMASVETGYALRNKTEYLLASAPEVLKPGFTPIYPNSLGLLFKSTSDLEEFAQEFFDYFDKLKGPPYSRSAAISVVKTSEMDALADFTREIAPELTQEQINKVQYYDRNGRPNVFFDYRDYIAQVATDAQMAELDELLDKAVIFKRSTPKLIKLPIPRHSGLSVYIPQDGLPRLNEAYEQTEWYKAVKN